MAVRPYKSKSNSPGWRKYQSRLKKDLTKKNIKARIFRYSPVSCIVLLMAYGLVTALTSTACQNIFLSPDIQQAGHAKTSSHEKALMTKEEAQAAVGGKILENLENKDFDVRNGKGSILHVDTTIDPDLQEVLMSSFDRRYSRYIGIVVMEPSQGKIVAMAGYDRNDPVNNPCVESIFPAASIIKIITASAGIEKCGFGPSSRFAFNGGKYTLYRYQLKKRTNKYTNWITLRNSFAQSVNPVFGKIGANYLGKMILDRYASAFGFNKGIEFEVPLSKSRLFLDDDYYNWAEIACGFNRKTRISPVHGAMLVATLLNNGMVLEPTVVETITNQDDSLVYHTRKKIINNAVSPDTSKVVLSLMRTTIKSGTSRKIFRGYKRDRVLSKLDIGGKTGSICSRKEHDVRYDWFVGFAEEKSGMRKLAVAAVVAHEKYIGRRAGYYAKLAIRNYFDDYSKSNAKAALSAAKKKTKAIKS